MKITPIVEKGHLAKAKSLDVTMSFKHSVEISKAIRYKSTAAARKILENVVTLRRAIPFKTYKQNVAHKRTMAAGRYPEKAARQFLKLIHSVEANAQAQGLNTARLKITKLMANLASIPFTGGRFRHATKRTNLEIEVSEIAGKDSTKISKASSKTANRNESHSSEKAKTNPVKVNDHKPMSSNHAGDYSK